MFSSKPMLKSWHTGINGNYYVSDITVPHIDKLIDSLGGEDYLKVIVNARGFEYKTVHPFIFMSGLMNPAKVEVEFSLGWDANRWVCNIAWQPSTYTASLRSLPMCKDTHDIYSMDFQKPECLKEWLEVKTELALSF
jgi:hypothetical protein